MAGLSRTPVLPKRRKDDMLLNEDLERMIEDVENLSVQLSWMSYDVVALRTRPQLTVHMRELEEAYRRCRDAVCGEPCQKPETDSCPGNAAKNNTPKNMM